MISQRCLRRGAMVVAALVVLHGAPAAQVRREVLVGAVGTSANPVAVTAGPGMAVRLGRRDRVVAWAGLGTADGALAARGEALYHFLLSPASTGAGFYLGGGIAGDYSGQWRGLLVGLLGVEAAPGGRQGWFAEAGFGGGFRAGAGFRWRW